jgi:hypothetical protein
MISEFHLKMEGDPQAHTDREQVEAYMEVVKEMNMDTHMGVCVVYIRTIEITGLTGQDAVDYAVDVAVNKGVDINLARTAAELVAERYDSTYDHETLDVSSGYNSVNCSEDPTWENRFAWYLKCRCDLEARPFAAAKWMHEFHLWTGLFGQTSIEFIIDYTTWNGGTNRQAVCVGFYQADSFGYYVTSAISIVGDSAAFACIEEEDAEAWALEDAQEQYPWYSP